WSQLGLWHLVLSQNDSEDPQHAARPCQMTTLPPPGDRAIWFADLATNRYPGWVPPRRPRLSAPRPDQTNRQLDQRGATTLGTHRAHYAPLPRQELQRDTS